MHDRDVTTGDFLASEFLASEFQASRFLASEFLAGGFLAGGWARARAAGAVLLAVGAFVPVAGPVFGQGGGIVYHYACPDGAFLSARPLSRDEMAVEDGKGGAFRMRQVRSASGARYQGPGGVEFSTQQGQATLTQGKVSVTCRQNTP